MTQGVGNGIQSLSPQVNSYNLKQSRSQCHVSPVCSQISLWPPDNSCTGNTGTTTGRRETPGTDIWHQQKNGKAKGSSGEIRDAFKIRKGKCFSKEIKGKWFAATFHLLWCWQLLWAWSYLKWSVHHSHKISDNTNFVSHKFWAESTTCTHQYSVMSPL